MKQAMEQTEQTTENNTKSAVETLYESGKHRVSDVIWEKIKSVYHDVIVQLAIPEENGKSCGKYLWTYVFFTRTLSSVKPTKRPMLL